MTEQRITRPEPTNAPRADYHSQTHVQVNPSKASLMQRDMTSDTGTVSPQRDYREVTAPGTSAVIQDTSSREKSLSYFQIVMGDDGNITDYFTKAINRDQAAAHRHFSSTDSAETPISRPNHTDREAERSAAPTSQPTSQPPAKVEGIAKGKKTLLQIQFDKLEKWSGQNPGAKFPNKVAEEKLAEETGLHPGMLSFMGVTFEISTYTSIDQVRSHYRGKYRDRKGARRTKKSSS